MVVSDIVLRCAAGLYQEAGRSAEESIDKVVVFMLLMCSHSSVSIPKINVTYV